MHTANQVANRLLELADEAGRSLTPMQLIKLVYLCQGWMLGIKGRPLFKESVEAWAYGPVVRNVYEAARKYRDQPVSKKISEDEVQLDTEEEDIIQQTFDQYGTLPGLALSTLTHKEGSPWSVTYERHGQNAIIPEDLIQTHFHDLAVKRISS